ncbi:MAG: ASCH domain-containing protein [Chloroflexi bacterium]|nr:MAG: ASCH domain-containing protein [Chloroflexota bacterium]
MRLPSTTFQMLLAATTHFPHWYARLQAWQSQVYSNHLHLAIVREPYLSRLLAGSKRVESRFACDRRPPFGRVQPGDILLLKRAGGPLAGLALVEHALSRPLTDLNEVRTAYSDDLAITDPHFWQHYAHARYFTLIWPDEVIPLPAIPLPRHHRSGWEIIER